jgi:hypothetical protein
MSLSSSSGLARGFAVSFAARQGILGSSPRMTTGREGSWNDDERNALL